MGIGGDLSPSECRAVLIAQRYLVYKFAAQSGYPEEQLWDFASDGLEKSLKTFDPTKGIKFKTWADKCMYFALLEAVHAPSWLQYRLPQARRSPTKRSAYEPCRQPDFVQQVENASTVAYLRQQVARRCTPRVLAVFDALAEGYKPREIARQRGVTDAAISQVIHQIRRLLKKVM